MVINLPAIMKKGLMKYLLTLVLFVSTFAIAQDVADPVTPPWANNALITLIVTTVLGLLSVAVRKIPGKVGEYVQWLVDLLSANVKHK